MGTLILNATSQSAAGPRVAMTESIKANNPAGMAHAAGDPRSAGTTMAIEDVTLRYGDANGVLALDDVSLKVAKNEFCVIVGPSGCGKSSLLYLAAGLNDVTSGSIKVDGREVMVRIRLQLRLKRSLRLRLHGIAVRVRVGVAGRIIDSADAGQRSQHVVERTVFHHQHNDVLEFVQACCHDTRSTKDE